ncbi:hypothetical protein D9Q98_001802 [Chlorella vulgaris]|uniref:R3H-associated N-terminal domain-containing protein n=1 Tax=Chlorella vulgaris TaxID=3077 RepID=A0A9D4TV40_CHLVU|nr:hypothetical protein D9Q98_001802 [Chlorella vulgaris]
MTEAAVAESPDQQRSRGPFLMPDGRPLDLSSFLDCQQQLRPPRGSSHSSRRPGAIKEPKQGWTKAVPHAAATSASAVVSSEAEQAEMYALSRVGHRKQRRWLNDKLLRDMAGALTAADMASLFKPAPFGETRTSLWEQAAQPEHAVLWNYFRSVEMDKQGRVLEKWQSHVRELQARPAVVHNPAVDALTAWARVNWKARQAMKRAGPCFVQATEDQVLSFSEDDGAGEEMVVSGLEDGFHRLIAHGLAEFHGMPSHSRVLEDGSKEVVVRRRTQATAAGAIVAQVSSCLPAGWMAYRGTSIGGFITVID